MSKELTPEDRGGDRVSVEIQDIVIDGSYLTRLLQHHFPIKPRLTKKQERERAERAKANLDAALALLNRPSQSGRARMMVAEVKATVANFKTWEECENKIRSIEQRYSSQQPGVWFRGHSNSNWDLLSTLERRSAHFGVADYFALMRRVSPEIEALTGRSLEMPDRQEVERCASLYDELRNLLVLGYSPMAYLRHHGFPSPLLDWSASPYVAAYFAFARATEVDSVAIYVYVERPKSFKISGSDEPQISALGPIVRTHARHFRQQSRYTVCTKFDQQGGWAFAAHQAVFQVSGTEQDFLWKLCVPASERKKVLSSLERYNLNAFSLFGTEESLIETLDIRLLDFPKQ